MPDSFLVIDDSKLVQQMYQLIFSRGRLAGSTVHYADNGREGLSLLAAHPELTLVLLDLNMPEMNGLELLARRHAEDIHPHIPIALVTTEDSKDDEVRGRDAGAWDYLRKPFQPADVERLVELARARTPTRP
ncbi:MAG TPA: response regulator [Gemmatimonadales bacterium]|jgi:CheY-like chemotaxis protein|nr:response regulator [Gemmatimonadales bacterium]